MLVLGHCRVSRVWPKLDARGFWLARMLAAVVRRGVRSVVGQVAFVPRRCTRTLSELGELLSELSAKDAERLVADGTVSGGMTPKVAAAVGAIENGAKAARIVDGRASWLDAWGTQIT